MRACWVPPQLFLTRNRQTRELIVKPIKRLFKRRSVATQSQMNSLYKPPKFSMESRYAFLLQVCTVATIFGVEMNEANK